MSVTIPPAKLPPVAVRKQPLRRPWNIDKDCVLCFMPEVNTKWLDYSGKGNNGTITTATKRYDCRFGEGLLFDGANDYVTVAHSASINFTASNSIGIWLRITDITADDRDVFAKFDGVTMGYLLYFDDAKKFRIYYGATGATDFALSTTVAVQDVWYYVTGVYDGTDTKIYVNGVWENDAVTPRVPAAVVTDFIVASRNGGASNWFKGNIDELHLYNRALASWEIKALYELGKPGGI